MSIFFSSFFSGKAQTWNRHVNTGRLNLRYKTCKWGVIAQSLTQREFKRTRSYSCKSCPIWAISIGLWVFYCWENILKNKAILSKDTTTCHILISNLQTQWTIHITDFRTHDRTFHTITTSNKFSLTLSTAFGAQINYHSLSFSFDGIMSAAFSRAGDLQTHATPKWLLIRFRPGSNANPVGLSGHRWQWIEGTITPSPVGTVISTLDYIIVVNNARCCSVKINKSHHLTPRLMIV